MYDGLFDCELVALKQSSAEESSENETKEDDTANAVTATSSSLSNDRRTRHTDNSSNSNAQPFDGTSSSAVYS